MSQATTDRTTLSHRLANDVAIVTGGSQGIGRAVAERLAAEGAAIAVVARTEHNIRETVDDLVAGGADAIGVPCDVANREQVRAAVSDVVAHYGRVSILINHAGLFRAAPFIDMTDALWNELLRVNLTGMFIVGQEVARQMVQQRAGRIVNMASIAAHIAHSDQTAYAVTKAGIEAMTRTMAFELAPFGITVNAVAPGTIETRFTRGALSDEAFAERVRRIPLGRLGDAAEVAAAIAFLASPDASYLTGSVVCIDGGLSIGGVRLPAARQHDKRDVLATSGSGSKPS